MTRNIIGTEPLRKRSKAIPIYGALSFAVLIAIVGFVMMTFTSSPQMKGAALLWLPAALQLIAGVWFGPWLGLLAGGLGAYAAGIAAYGGWGLVDIIMNPIAGGVANSFLPAILFRAFKINPSFNSTPADIKKAIFIIASLMVIVLVIGLMPIYVTSIGKWAYVIAIGILLIGTPILLKGLRLNKRDLIAAMVIVVFISLVSALIGSYGIVVSGNTWQAAFIGTGLGWFLGDTVSAFLGIYALVYFTTAAERIGLVKKYWQ
uniref:Energy-coupling factor transport system substrate-specific component n=1 Tax=Candidatus Kentrum sp. SD TaxID=2126332 RepID=A0A451BRF9_9GAMM|nr:MAG: hypothetical protein BECKSD772D_GA0070982_11665 [Candidatus Kentron sp. SD]